MGVNDKVRGKTDIATSGGLAETGTLLYPGAQMSAVLGMTDRFRVTNRKFSRKEREKWGTRPHRLADFSLTVSSNEAQHILI
jgi:hypothetical protein